MPHPEHLDVVGRGKRPGRRTRTPAASVVGRLQQHGRVPVDGDRRRLEREHVLVDPAEPPVQPETARHVVDFHRTRAQVLQVHDYEERGDGVIADVPVDQVRAVHAYRQYGDGVREHYERDESDAAAAVRIRETRLVLARLVLVLAELVVHDVQYGLHPGHQAPDGYDLGYQGFDAHQHGRHFVLVTRLRRAYAVRRQNDVEQARGDHHERKQRIEHVFVVAAPGGGRVEHRPSCHLRVRGQRRSYKYWAGLPRDNLPADRDVQSRRPDDTVYLTEQSTEVLTYCLRRIGHVVLYRLRHDNIDNG